MIQIKILYTATLQQLPVIIVGGTVTVMPLGNVVAIMLDGISVSVVAVVFVNCVVLNIMSSTSVIVVEE